MLEGTNRTQNGWVKAESRKKRGKVWVGYWNSYVELDGSRKKRRKEKVIGLCSKITKGEAEKELRDAVIPAFENRSPVSHIPDAALTFEKAALKYLALSEPRWSKSFGRTMKSIIKLRIIPGLGKGWDQFNREYDRFPSDIKPTEVLTWLNSVAADSSRSLVKKCVTHVRAIFDLCVDDGVIIKNPARAKSVKPARGRDADQTFLDVGQIRSLLTSAAHHSRRDYLIVRVLLVCALRPSELFALRVNDVQSGTLTIDEAVVLGEIGDTKTTESHNPVPLPPTLRMELLAFIESEGISGEPLEFLFPSEMGTVMSHDNYLDRKLKRFAVDAGIPRLNFQMMRRTTATHFQNFGQVKDTQGLLRHKDAATTLNNYQKVITANLEKAASAWDDSLLVEERKPKK
jgi:integrase